MLHSVAMTADSMSVFPGTRLDGSVKWQPGDIVLACTAWEWWLAEILKEYPNGEFKALFFDVGVER